MKKIYSPCLVSVVHLAFFVVFGGFLAVVAAFYTPGPRGRFLAEIQIRCLIFPSNAKTDSPLVPFSGRLRKIFIFSSPIRTIFVSLLELSTFRYSLFPSDRPRHSLKSTSATAPTSICSHGVAEWLNFLTEIFYCAPEMERKI